MAAAGCDRGFTTGHDSTTLPLSMLLAPDQFAFARHLETGFSIFLRELKQLQRADFEPWPDPGAYGGEWLAFPLFLASHPGELDRHFARNQARCPESTAFLRTTPGVVSTGFSWMEPGCHIYPHVDAKPVNLLRAHVGLEIPEGALMRVGPDRHTWSTGRALVFDGYIEHETANTASVRRVVLLVDALLTGAEFEALQEWRRAHHVDVDGAQRRAGVM